MSRARAMFAASFRTKVLMPVILVMVLMLAVSMWLVNGRITRQLQANAGQQVTTAEAGLQITRQTRDRDLLLRFNSAQNEPRFKAAAKMFDFSSGEHELDPEQRRTFLGFLRDMITDNIADVIVLTPEKGQPLAVTRDQQLNLEAFQADAAEDVKQTADGRPRVDTLYSNDRLFDVVTIPIFVGEALVGAITFGVENSTAQEFERLTQSELVLLSDGRVVASTLRNPALAATLPERFARMTSRQTGADGTDTQEIMLGDEHYLCLAGWLGTGNGPNRLGYLILSTYEKPLQTLRSTQRMIFYVSLMAILFGSAVVWFLINRVTRPLRELRDSAEAVGRGDFTRRVPVRGLDECGELATVFNQMTENLQQSRAQLEKTVETLKTTQAQLVQSEKLSAVGEFVAGVAHELNNPLTAVTGFSELLKHDSVDANHRRHLDMIFKAAQRCQKIVQSLLSFARRHQPERKPVSLNSLVEAVLEIVSYPLRTSNIEVVTRLDPHLPVALADTHQIQQVLLNIVNNARQAIEAHQPSGRIKIMTEACDPNVRVIIQDNGPGIPEENMRRIFDPFFTTKEVGKGTGLGLSLCYGIIKEHGGSILPVSRPGEGATFIIELPVAHGVAGPVEPAPAKEADKLNPREGTGKRVLVIDDEEAILNLISEDLGRRGYDVTVATDGATALRQFGHNHFDAAFCDWKMPGLNGRQVYEQLRATNPDLCRRVVFITGDVVNEPMREFLQSERRPCLTKPFTIAQFHDTLKTVIAKG